MAFPLTQEQRNIVNDRGGELLVSAAAGTGKTRVLVERLLDRVTGEGLDIDRFLVITYTKAAAAELRDRIAQELTDRLAQNPGDRHLRRHRSPRSTPSVPPCCGRAAICWILTPICVCVTRSREKSS